MSQPPITVDRDLTASSQAASLPIPTGSTDAASASGDASSWVVPASLSSSGITPSLLAGTVTGIVSHNSGHGSGTGTSSSQTRLAPAPISGTAANGALKAPADHSSSKIVSASSQKGGVEKESGSSAKRHRDSSGASATTSRPSGHDRRSATGTGAKSSTSAEALRAAGRITNGRHVYQLGNKLGEGAYGVVLQAFNVDTGELVAVKRYSIKSVDDESLASMATEVELMQKLNHPNIVKYLSTITTRNHLYIVLEYMEEKSLSDVIKKFGSFSEMLSSSYLTQVLRGLGYLHDQGVLHRDIKGANILTSKDGLVKLADFGLAVKLSEVHNTEQGVGSAYWMAPEIIEGSAISSACDIWSVGCTCIEFLTGKPPYYDLNHAAAIYKIVENDCPPLPKVISQAAKTFILQCCRKEPSMRPSAERLLQHPWLQQRSKHSASTNETAATTTATSAADVEPSQSQSQSSVSYKAHQNPVLASTTAATSNNSRAGKLTTANIISINNSGTGDHNNRQTKKADTKLTGGNDVPTAAATSDESIRLSNLIFRDDRKGNSGSASLEEQGERSISSQINSNDAIDTNHEHAFALLSGLASVDEITGKVSHAGETMLFDARSSDENKRESAEMRTSNASDTNMKSSSNEAPVPNIVLPEIDDTVYRSPELTPARSNSASSTPATANGDASSSGSSQQIQSQAHSPSSRPVSIGSLLSIRPLSIGSLLPQPVRPMSLGSSVDSSELNHAAVVAALNDDADSPRYFSNGNNNSTNGNSNSNIQVKRQSSSFTKTSDSLKFIRSMMGIRTIGDDAHMVNSIPGIGCSGDIATVNSYSFNDSSSVKAASPTASVYTSVDMTASSSFTEVTKPATGSMVTQSPMKVASMLFGAGGSGLGGVVKPSSSDLFIARSGSRSDLLAVNKSIQTQYSSNKMGFIDDVVMYKDSNYLQPASAVSEQDVRYSDLNSSFDQPESQRQIDKPRPLSERSIFAGHKFSISSSNDELYNPKPMATDRYRFPVVVPANNPTATSLLPLNVSTTSFNSRFGFIDSKGVLTHSRLNDSLAPALNFELKLPTVAEDSIMGISGGSEHGGMSGGHQQISHSQQLFDSSSRHLSNFKEMTPSNHSAGGTLASSSSTSGHEDNSTGTNSANNSNVNNTSSSSRDDAASSAIMNNQLQSLAKDDYSNDILMEKDGVSPKETSAKFFSGQIAPSDRSNTINAGTSASRQGDPLVRSFSPQLMPFASRSQSQSSSVYVPAPSPDDNMVGSRSRSPIAGTISNLEVNTSFSDTSLSSASAAGGDLLGGTNSTWPTLYTTSLNSASLSPKSYRNNKNINSNAVANTLDRPGGSITKSSKVLNSEVHDRRNNRHHHNQLPLITPRGLEYYREAASTNRDSMSIVSSLSEDIMSSIEWDGDLANINNVAPPAVQSRQSYGFSRALAHLNTIPSVIGPTNNTLSAPASNQNRYATVQIEPQNNSASLSATIVSPTPDSAGTNSSNISGPTRTLSRKRSYTLAKNILVEELRDRMKRALSRNATVNTQVDATIDSLYFHDLDDEFDLQHNKEKDIQMRLAKDLLDIMSKIKPYGQDKVVHDGCESLLQQLNMYPERREYLLLHYGVMPILDMFEARSETGAGIIIRHHILRVVNKLIQGNLKIQEQLSLVGIIPAIMRILENGCRSCLINYRQDSLYASLQYLLPNVFRPPPIVVEPIVTEAATFVHLITSTSPVTLQMFIGAGGLNALVQMIALGELIVTPNLMPLHQRNQHKLWNSVTRHVGKAWNHGISGSLLCHSEDQIDNVVSEKAASVRADDPSRINGHYLFRFDESVASPAYHPIHSISNDAMRLVYLGIDCIHQVFTIHASRSRDFCRVFVKLGLLPHLSVSFFNVMYIYHKAYMVALIKPSQRQLRSQPGSPTFPFSTVGSFDFDFDNVYSNDNIDVGLTSVDESGQHFLTENDADSSQEYNYALAIATIFFNFSRSNAKVAEQMAKQPDLGREATSTSSATPGTARATSSSGTAPNGSATSTQPSKAMSILNTILLILRTPELRISVVSTSVPFVTPSTATRGLSPSSERINISNVAHTSNGPGNNGDFENHCSILTSPSGKSIMLSNAYLKIMLLLLKCVKNLSMEQATLLDMEHAGTIPTLVPLLDGPIGEKCKNQIFPCLFNLCRVNKQRQEQAAVCGLIPHLQRVIRAKSHLQQFALPIICNMAHGSAVARRELWKHDGVTFFIDLLKEEYWQTFAFNALSSWLSQDTQNVQTVVVQPNNISKLIDFFRSSTIQTMRNIHNPWLDMMIKSSVFSRALGASGLFVLALVKRLHVSQEALVLCSLLKMLQTLHRSHASPRQLVLDNDLYSVVRGIALLERQVLVSQVANRLLVDFQESTMT